MTEIIIKKGYDDNVMKNLSVNFILLLILGYRCSEIV